MDAEISLPKHVAIVMDGNGRWANQRRIPVAAGHKAGVESVRTILQACFDAGVYNLTLFAFSSENWRRPTLEVDALMTLFSSYLDSELEKLMEEKVRLRFIGRRDRFSKKLIKKIEYAEQLTSVNSTLNLTLAVDYGGQWDIVEAGKVLAKKCLDGDLDPEQIDEQLFQEQLCLNELPTPDLLIRTSGEHRISNFLLWQLAYAEFYFTDTLWPDFDAQEFQLALDSFAGRERRYGGRLDKKHA